MADNEKVTFDANKEEDFPAWYEQILRFADVIDKRYPVKGMPVWRPYGYFMHDKIMQLVEGHWDATGHQRNQFPLLIPYSFLAKEEDHIRGFEEECFWVTHGGSKQLEEKLALRPTSETAMYYMFSIWLRTYRDLPLKVHQTCNVFRHETKDTRPLIRAREIFWNEAHTAHATEEEAITNLEQAWTGYMDVIENQCAFTGLRIRRPEWDKFAGGVYTDVMDSIMPDGKVLQSVGAHYLGQKFAKVFDITVLNQKNKKEMPYMTCYGVSTRLLASCLSAHGDNKGLVVPPAICKHQVIIVPIVMKKKDRTPVEAAREYEAALIKAGVRVFVDDGNQKPGEKFFHHEMRGAPLRLEVGPRDVKNGTAVLFRRDLPNKEDKLSLQKDEVVEKIVAELTNVRDRLLAKAKAYFNDHITTCTTTEEMIEAVRNKGGFARVPFCSIQKDGKDADEIIHEACGGEVRGYIPSEEAPTDMKCIATGKPATVWGYVARAY